MDDDLIAAMVNHPDPALAHFAMEQANLSKEEMEVINLTVHENETNQSTADLLFMTIDKVKRRKKSAMFKLDYCWSGKPWVQQVCTYTNIKQ